jgi:auxin influx carrier (AUX1 LAX family)
MGCFCFLFFFDLLQVAQVLLTLPYSFSQLGMLSGILFQLFYGLLGSWTAYLISVLYVEYRTRKEREKVDFRNHVIQVWFHTFDQLDDMKKTSLFFPLLFEQFSHMGGSMFLNIVVV